MRSPQYVLLYHSEMTGAYRFVIKRDVDESVRVMNAYNVGPVKLVAYLRGSVHTVRNLMALLRPHCNVDVAGFFTLRDGAGPEVILERMRAQGYVELYAPPTPSTGATADAKQHLEMLLAQHRADMFKYSAIVRAMRVLNGEDVIPVEKLDPRVISAADSLGLIIETT